MVENLGASGIDIRVGVKTRPSEQFEVLRELRTRLKERFDREGIETSSPQRTLWVEGAAGANTTDLPADGSATRSRATSSSVGEGDLDE